MPYTDKTKRLLHAVWRNMIGRCHAPDHPNMKMYGDRGISVCNEWRVFAPFYEWALSNGYKQGLTLDRKDNDGNYEPENCRWVTQKINSNNRSNNHYVTYNGITKTVQEWADELGITNQALCDRLKSDNWTLQESLTTPKNGRPVRQPKFCKEIMQFTKEGVFVRKWGSVSEAAKELHLHNENISRALTSKYTAGGYCWEYANK